MQVQAAAGGEEAEVEAVMEERRCSHQTHRAALAVARTHDPARLSRRLWPLSWFCDVF